MKKVLFLLLSSILILGSCKKESESPIIQGNDKGERIATFNDHDEMNSFIMNSNIKKDFISYKEHCEKALEFINSDSSENPSTPNENAIEGLLTKADNGYHPAIESELYGRLINKDRIYIVNNTAYKVLDNEYMIIADKNNLQELKGLETINGLDDKRYEVVKYKNSNSDDIEGFSGVPCKNGITANYFKNNPECRWDRMVYVQAIAEPLYGEDRYGRKIVTPYFYIKTWGEKRSALFCRWRPNYKTTFHLKNMAFSGYFMNGTISSIQTFKDIALADKGSGNVRSLTRFYKGTPVRRKPGIDAEIQFEKVHAEAKSRGTGTTYAVLDCHTQ